MVSRIYGYTVVTESRINTSIFTFNTSIFTFNGAHNNIYYEDILIAICHGKRNAVHIYMYEYNMDTYLKQDIQGRTQKYKY